MNAHTGVVLKPLMLVVFLLFSAFIPVRQVQADSGVNVGVSVFHDALAPYGNWVNHRTYGQVWYPRNVAQNWRPYTDGYWAHTDDYGWLWVSYQPWGWAPFHYGRWAWDNWYGWIWVPGRTWAPAWVFWRSGGGYAAWTPMPPNVVWQPGVGLNISYFNYDRDIRWDSWVAVHEHDLPNRHINQHINPPSQNRQIINVTHYNNNVTLINNTIVNQGVPVKQIEEVTRRPLEAVVPKVHDRLDINTAELHEGQPDIIRLPMTAPTPDEIHHNEELARRLDGKNPDGTRTELPLANSGQAGEHEPRVPGRLVGAPAPVQAPYAIPERPNQALVEPVGQALPEPVIPKAPLLSLDPDTPHKTLNAGSHQETLVPAQQTTPQSSVTLQPIAPVPAQIDGASAPISLPGQQPVLTDMPVKPPLQNELKPSDLQSDGRLPQVPVVDQAPVLPQTEGTFVSIPVTGQQPVLTDAPTQPFLQNEPQPSEAFKQSDNTPSQVPAVDQQQMENLQRQQKIDQLQQELARSQNKQQQQETGTQPQQVEHPVESVQPIQQPEAARQQPIQTQQQTGTQTQQVERPVEPVQQNQQPEAAHQQPIQNQQQIDTQSQQAERAQQEAQQMQQQEAARQQQIQTQQQTDTQSQQAERAQQEAQQMQQQEAVRQQQIQNQQQIDMQPQQVERPVEPVQPIQQPVAAQQQQIDTQSQQAERAQQEAQQMQQQEAARQQQQPANQPSVQNQQPPEIQRKQTERPKEEPQQIQQQEAVTPQ